MSRFGIGLATAARSFIKTFCSSYSTADNASSYTFSSCSIGTPSTDREVFVIMAFYTNKISVKTVTAVTIGGVSASLGAQFNNGYTQSVALARAVVPSGSTGDIVISLSGTAGSMAIAVYSLTGRSASGTAASDTSSITGYASTSFAITGVDVPAGGVVFSALMISAGSSSYSISGLSMAVDASASQETTLGCAFASSSIQASASTGATVTWSWVTNNAGLAATWSFQG